MRGSDFDWIVSSLSATVCDTLVQRCHICEKRSKVCAPGSFGMMAFLCAGVGQNALVERKRMHVDSGSTQCPVAMAGYEGDSPPTVAQDAPWNCVAFHALRRNTL